MGQKNNFLLQKDHLEEILYLSDEQAGRLIKSIFAYVNDEEPLEMDSTTTIFFLTLKKEIAFQENKYNEICKKRSENGRKGGKQKQANARFAKQNKQMLNLPSHNDNHNDNHNESFIVMKDVVKAKNFTLSEHEQSDLLTEFENIEYINNHIISLDNWLEANPKRKVANAYNQLRKYLIQDRGQLVQKGDVFEEWLKENG